MMKIRVKTEPTFICLKKVAHHPEYLASWVGIECEATESQDHPDTYLVEAMQAIMALVKANKIMGATYWNWLWNQSSGLRAFYFPKEACEIVAS